MKLTALVLASIGLIGCGKAPAGRAFIDIEQVVRSEPSGYVPIAVSPTKPASSSGSTRSIPPLAERKLDFTENVARLAKVQQAVDEAREQSARQIARKLREAYLAEIDVIETERLSKMGAVRNEAFERAWARVRSRFLVYANARAPHAIRLALYAGFPDPDPQGVRLPPETQKARQRRFERAGVARTTLQELDAAYETDIRSLLAEFDDEVTAEVLKVRAEIENMRAEAEARAVHDAAAQVSEVAQQTESVLSGRAAVQLPAQPGRQAVVPGGAPVPSAPTIRFQSREEAEADKRKAVRSEADIWAAHFGVQLVESAKQGPDRTKEFVEWRKQRLSGH